MNLFVRRSEDQTLLFYTFIAGWQLNETKHQKDRMACLFPTFCRPRIWDVALFLWSHREMKENRSLFFPVPNTVFPCSSHWENLLPKVSLHTGYVRRTDDWLMALPSGHRRAHLSLTLPNFWLLQLSTPPIWFLRETTLFLLLPLTLWRNLHKTPNPQSLHSERWPFPMAWPLAHLTFFANKWRVQVLGEG